MPHPLFAPLALSVLTFQSHWLDDIASGAGDTSGLMVSLAGSARVVGGGFRSSYPAGRWLLTAGWAFMAYISAADLVGLSADGSLAPSVLEHWLTGLRPTATVAVAITGMASVICLVRVWSGPPIPGGRGGAPPGRA